MSRASTFVDTQSSARNNRSLHQNELNFAISLFFIVFSLV